MSDPTHDFNPPWLHGPIGLAIAVLFAVTLVVICYFVVTCT